MAEQSKGRGTAIFFVVLGLIGVAFGLAPLFALLAWAVSIPTVVLGTAFLRGEDDPMTKTLAAVAVGFGVIGIALGVWGLTVVAKQGS
jgi:hypothetical protein